MIDAIRRFLPDNERWLHHPKTKSEIDEAISWAEHRPPQATDLDELERRVSPKQLLPLASSQWA